MTLKKFELPEWTRSLPNHTTLTGHDIKPIFGYQKGSDISGLITKGKVPKPDKEHNLSLSYGTNRKKHLWTLGYLRQLEQQQ